jgi:peroxiredoxin (alkyl hydroperoxide reductase subunit C)
MTIRTLPGGGLRLGEAAPHFEAESTVGLVKLSDYRGRWLVFFAHPADFTPVCASEFVSFGRHAEQFKALNCALLGLSADTIQAHISWIETLRRESGVTIDFPIIEDRSMKIARRYRMTASETGQSPALRALFVIDPKGILRAMLYYPCSTGRSVEEILRLVRALQIADSDRALTPEGWQPGHGTFNAAPQTVIAASGRDELSYGCVDWYYYSNTAHGEPGAPGDARLIRREPVQQAPSATRH